ncbi:hypothetical protein [Pedobacter nutrimenti]|uniref:Uncharacterized protein n=1 Tax=Pedobacter nutrimenti TaxID=1241337 RepID=A0A318U8W8_9SPHI|nr:hypothetical protein [Pedobacter nutrimenti]PYF68459.1 hypothetical protein B0O44_11246 [Pedobacter nutrimenti]
MSKSRNSRLDVLMKVDPVEQINSPNPIIEKNETDTGINELIDIPQGIDKITTIVKKIDKKNQKKLEVSSDPVEFKTLKIQKSLHSRLKRFVANNEDEAKNLQFFVEETLSRALDRFEQKKKAGN